MEVVKIIAAWIYGLQAFIVVPSFLGAIYRHEQSAWALREYALTVKVHGEGDALFGLYSYAIFYAAFFIIPYVALSIWLDPYESQPSRETRVDRILISLWFGFSFFLFMEPLFNFIRVIPTDVWNGWLLVLWGAATIVSGNIVYNLRRYRIRNTSNTSNVE